MELLETCAHCYEIKDATEFPKHSGKKNGLGSWCKGCVNESRRNKRGNPRGPNRTKEDIQNQIKGPRPVKGEIAIYYFEARKERILRWIN